MWQAALMPYELPCVRCNPPTSVPNRTQSAVNRRSTWYLSSNYILSRPKPECARLASAVHRDVVPTTYTNTRSRPAIITHTHTHTRTRTRERAGLCMPCGLHSVGQRISNKDSNSSACATEGGGAEFAGRAQRRSATRGSGRGVREALRSRGIRRITDSLRWEAANVVPSRKIRGEGRNEQRRMNTGALSARVS